VAQERKRLKVPGNFNLAVEGERDKTNRKVLTGGSVPLSKAGANTIRTRERKWKEKGQRGKRGGTPLEGEKESKEKKKKKKNNPVGEKTGKNKLLSR